MSMLHHMLWPQVCDSEGLDPGPGSLLYLMVHRKLLGSCCFTVLHSSQDM